MICTHTGTTDRNVRGKRRLSMWTTSRATVLLTACLLIAGLLPSTVGAQATCSTAISNNPGLVSDCEALLSALDTLDPNGKLNWSADVAMGDWNGVTLSGTPPRVTDISLIFVWLGGSIPPELGNLANLQRLYLPYNSLNGSIPPELGNLANLEGLYLDSNQLSGSLPPELGNLANLKVLDLYLNHLSGSIPPELGNLANLEFLDLEDNGLSGSIPPELGNLANLEELILEGNALSGSIPSELGNLTNLQRLDLAYNALSGSIPPELGNLANLEFLSMYYNEVSGAIPPELGNLANLEGLHLDFNALSGSIPPELGNLASLEWLALAYNSLSGAIPPELGNLANLEVLSLKNNALSGWIPSELGNLANLEALGLSYNALSGPIPPELGNLANLIWLHLDFNSLHGPIPPELGNLANLKKLVLFGNDVCIPASHQDDPFFQQLTYFPVCRVTLDIVVSPATSVPYGEEITLTAEADAPAQVASYRWMDAAEFRVISTQQSVTVGGAGWPSSPGMYMLQAVATMHDGSRIAAYQPITFTDTSPRDEVSVNISVSPGTSVSYTKEVTLTAEVSGLSPEMPGLPPVASVKYSNGVGITAEMPVPTQVVSYRWAHVDGSQNIGTQQAVTLGGAGWPNSPGTRTFQAIVTLNDGSQVTAEQSITFTNPPPPPSGNVSVSIAVSPATSVSHTETVTLTAHVSDLAQVASYRWAHVGGWDNFSTNQSMTLDGGGWPNSPGTRTFQAIVTLNDGSQVTAEQSITFTNPPPPPSGNVSVSIAVSPATSVSHTETVTLTARVSDPAQVASYRWAHVGGWDNFSTETFMILDGAGWPNNAGTRTFQAIVTLNDGSQVMAEQSITFTNP